MQSNASRRQQDRWFWAALAMVAAILAGEQVLSIRSESQTWDEGFEIVGGYQYLTTGQYRPSLENPPLERILEALPLLLLRPELKGAALEANNTAASDVDAGVEFLYRNRIPADALLFAARLPMIAVTVALMLALGLWCRKRFGPAAALTAAFLFALDPTVIAHGRYVKNDMTVAATAFLAVIAWDWFLRVRSSDRPICRGCGKRCSVTAPSRSRLCKLLQMHRPDSEPRAPASGPAGLSAPSSNRPQPSKLPHVGQDCILQPICNRRFLPLASAGVALGLAIGSKFSALFLLPVFAILFILRERRSGVRAVGRFLKSCAIAGVLAAGVLLLLYAPYAGALVPRGRGAPGVPLRDAIDQSTSFGRGAAYIGSRLGWRSHPLLIGLAQFASHGGGTHPAYVLGQNSDRGWWYYFPLAFAVKTPVAVLIAIALGIPVAIAEPVLSVPILVYGALAAANHVDIGLRHLLPIYPFLYALAGAGLMNLRWRFRPWLLGLILLGAAAESWAAFPYYTAFFNVLAGGSRNGPKVLVDSNLDWGQDLKRLGRFAAERGSPPVCIVYFGTAPTWYYLRSPMNFPSLEEMREGKPFACDYAAVSVTPLEGVYVPSQWLAWLRDLAPLQRIGYSIYVWDVRDPAFQRAYAMAAGAR